MDIAFRPVEKTDLAMLGSWLDRPHFRQWWGEAETELGHIRDMIAGRDTTRPFIFSVDGKPAGYIQYWFVGDHQNAAWIDDNPWLGELPEDTVGVDLSIADGGDLSKGIGSSVLRRFVETLVDDGYRRIIIDPDRRNLRAIRAYEKAGFRPVASMQGRTGDTLIMQYDPNKTSRTYD